MLDGENKLIRDAIRGVSSAFGSLYGHYQPQIYRFVFLKVGRREEAEDITHQVFLSAWTSIASYEERGYPFSSWLYQIGRNKVIDHYRAQRTDLPLQDAEETLVSDEDSPLEDFETKATMEEVHLAIMKLKPEYQEVIILRFVEDLPLKDVALTLGKSEGAIKLLQHRAIKNLKSNLI